MRHPFPVVFLHGLESGPSGAKVDELTADFGSENISVPDCRGVLELEERLKICLAHIQEIGKPVFLVGSSFGGLIAGLIATRHPELVTGMVLCAPALHRKEAAEIDLHHAGPVTVIHGEQDEIVPIQASYDFCRQFQAVRLVVVQDNHRLSGNSGLISQTAWDMNR